MKLLIVIVNNFPLKQEFLPQERKAASQEIEVRRIKNKSSYLGLAGGTSFQTPVGGRFDFQSGPIHTQFSGWDTCGRQLVDISLSLPFSLNKHIYFQSLY